MAFYHLQLFRHRTSSFSRQHGLGCRYRSAIPLRFSTVSLRAHLKLRRQCRASAVAIPQKLTVLDKHFPSLDRLSTMAVAIAPEHGMVRTPSASGIHDALTGGERAGVGRCRKPQDSVNQQESERRPRLLALHRVTSRLQWASVELKGCGWPFSQGPPVHSCLHPAHWKGCGRCRLPLIWIPRGDGWRSQRRRDRHFAGSGCRCPGAIG